MVGEAVDPDREPAGEQGGTWETIRRVLEAAREQLQMDVTFLAQFAAETEVFRAVAGDSTSFGLAEGAAVARVGTYCQAMIDGRVGNVIPDAAAEPAVADLQVTSSGRIGRYIGVPVHLPDGRLYGALCGLGHDSDSSLRQRDAGILRVLATVVEAELARDKDTVARRAELTARIEPLLDGAGMDLVFQPIVDLATSVTTGFEALARLRAEPERTPDIWFAEADEVGLGVELEMTAVRRALTGLERLPPESFLSLNVSPATACSPILAETIGTVELSRIVLEITEHAAVANYRELTTALAGLRAAGVRLAVDDAGAGVASLHHILALAPELIKMDISFTRGVDTDPARTALVTALVSFGAATGAAILAEGIETPGELDTLRRLGVRYGQGYLLGRPGRLTGTQPSPPAGSSTTVDTRPAIPPAARPTAPAAPGGCIDWSRVFAQAAGPVAALDSWGRYVQVNAAFCRLVGCDAEAPLEPGEWCRAQPRALELARDVACRFAPSARAAAPVEFEQRYARPDGSTVWLALDCTPLPGPDGASRYVVIRAKDVTDRRAAEQLWKSTFEQSPIGMGVVDLGGCWVSVNGAFCDLVGYGAEELVGRPIGTLTFPGDEVNDAAAIRDLTSGKLSSVTLEKRYRHKDGHPIWVLVKGTAVVGADGGATHFLSYYEDIGERRQRDARLAHMALHDPLTGLANRSLLSERLTDALAALTRDGGLLVILWCDLDGFKLVNDRYGHAVGDQLLVAAAALLRSETRASDVVARVGGDEFVVVSHLPGYGAGQAQLVRDKIERALNTDVVVASSRLRLRATVGLATTGDSSGAPAALLHAADMDMYSRKRRPRRQVELT